MRRRLGRLTRLLRAIRRGLRYEELSRIQFFSGLGDSAWILYGLVRALKPEVCVEIGAARGKSACYVAMALRENGRGMLHSIDPHMPTAWNDAESVETYEVFGRNVRRLGLSGFVKVERAMSTDAICAWKAAIDVLFIDGDHSYEGVKRDWELFAPFVRPFGIVVFHDTLWDLSPDPRYARRDMGVPRFLEELRCSGYPMVTFDKNFGVTLVQPTPGGISLRRGDDAASRAAAPLTKSRLTESGVAGSPDPREATR